LRLEAIPDTRIVYVHDDPGIPEGMSADPFAGIESLLAEGKAIGSASMKANVGERDRFMRNIPTARVREAIQRSSANASRVLTRIYNSYRRSLQGVVGDLSAQTTDIREARLRSSKLIREAYERVRVVARNASGMARLGADTAIFREEEKWFRSAVREEVGYFHGFLDDIENNRTHRIAERVEDYTKAIRFMYEAARVQAMPDNVLLYWTGPRKRDDPKVCEGCEYLMERSPFPKDTIPAVPRDGQTPCLVNCRHRILVRVVRSMNEVVRRRVTLPRRDKMVKHLNEVKKANGLGRSTPRVTGKAKNPFKGDPLTKHVSRPIR